ncbi:MAG: hypothetical protein M1546_18875 [Chloroflexi bacterium]|nr:hypothetical protein [Chloroflexota bacterium]
MKKTSAHPKSIVLKGSPTPRIQQTFEEWQDEQQRDTRTPEERGIRIGSPVMWRYRNGRVIVTERATVMAISDNTLTLLVKDVPERTCHADVREIVSSRAEHLSAGEPARRGSVGERVEPI